MGVVIYVMKIRSENIQRKTACQRQTSEFVLSKLYKPEKLNVYYSL